MKLWQKGIPLDTAVESYTVGEDPILDHRLVPYDCRASIAQAKMLNKIGLLSEQECSILVKTLKEIITLHSNGDFIIQVSDEDCHTAIENYLVKHTGDAGKKIHTGRSRNDQVLTALRLYYLDMVKEMIAQVQDLTAALDLFASANSSVPLPGYTHTRKAMPTTIAVWAQCFRDAMIDNEKSLNYLLDLLDQSPLGSAAGYGTDLGLDKEFTAREMGFTRVQENPIYTQHSRGKFDADIVHQLSQIMFDLNRLSSDLILFTEPATSYFILPEKFTTGSSIMPQKKNPDVFELVRGNSHLVLGYEMQIKSLSSNLIMGYHRDYQLLKKPVFQSLDITIASVHIMVHVFKDLKTNEDACKKAMTKELYATERAYELVKQGLPFRDAYRKVKEEFSQS